LCKRAPEAEARYQPFVSMTTTGSTSDGFCSFSKGLVANQLNQVELRE